MALYRIAALIHIGDGSFHVCCLHIGQKAQTPQIHTNDGSPLGPHPAGSLQEGAVATERQYEVGIEGVATKLMEVADINGAPLGEQGSKSAVDTHHGSM